MERCHILREDPDLGSSIPADLREWAVEHCVASVLVVPRGAWKAERMQVMADGIGLLVLDGVLIRRVGIDGRFGAELLGSGDLLRPWQGEDAGSTVPQTSGWRVITPARMAVLDGRAAARLARYPALTGAIAARALNRARRLALTTAIVHQPRIEVRLHMLLWHLADRWGRVRRDGVIVPLPLSHTVLADMVAAQRPSVTTGLGKLVTRELVVPVNDGWLLRGDPPFELLELQEVDISQPEMEPPLTATSSAGAKPAAGSRSTAETEPAAGARCPAETEPAAGTRSAAETEPPALTGA